MITAIVASGDSMYSATGMLTAPSRAGSATCQTRSPVRSECRDQNTIATAPTANGTATISPFSRMENSVSKDSANPATMVGRKKLSA
ncbi:unannotated protein [freshwater metagenome]|uniref:Unannotated protein n=1 Tax=freshwater metagenome TaxID=449393 RepID=A0A6J7GJB0_9ZZZZ